MYIIGNKHQLKFTKLLLCHLSLPKRLQGGYLELGQRGRLHANSEVERRLVFSIVVGELGYDPNLKMLLVPTVVSSRLPRFFAILI